MTDRYQSLRDAIAAGPTETDWSVIDYGKPELLDGAQAQYQIGKDCLAYAFEAEDADFIAAADPDTIAALIRDRDKLREALRDLLMDTQHANHECDDEVYCPVKNARAALTDGEASNGS